MDVVLQYSADCPNWRPTAERLRLAVRRAGVDAGEVRLQQVSTAEQAERESFRGSPTVLVDGCDPFAEPGAPVGLTCRVFRTPEGLAGAPTVEQLVDALSRAHRR